MNDLRKHCMLLYGLYALSAVLQFFNKTVLIGFAAVVIAYFMTTARKGAAKDTAFASHLRWMLRTFWIGTAVIFPVAIIIASILVLIFTDFVPVMDAMNETVPEATMDTLHNYMQGNMTKISLITIPIMLLSALWWLRRCWAGYVLAKDGKPVEKVTSWL